MADVRARGGAGHGGSAAVAEQIQHADLSSGGARGTDFFRAPVPIHGLLGEEAGVFEVRGADAKGERAVADGPRFGQGAAKFPTSAARFGAMVEPIPTGPRCAPTPGPDDLRIGPHEDDVAPAFHLHAAAGFEELVVAPLVGEEEERWGGGHRFRTGQLWRLDRMFILDR